MKVEEDAVRSSSYSDCDPGPSSDPRTLGLSAWSFQPIRLCAFGSCNCLWGFKDSGTTKYRYTVWTSETTRRHPYLTTAYLSDRVANVDSICAVEDGSGTA